MSGASGALVLALANQKGGVGKTTTSITLAAAAAYAGKRVLLVDLDSQANATSGLGLQGIASTPASHYLVSPGEVRRFLLAGPIEGLDVLGSTPELIHIEDALGKLTDGSRQLVRALERLGCNYDVIFIDCPPSLGLLTRNALTAAGGVIVPIQCQYFAMEGLGRILQAIDEARALGNQSLAVHGIVLTMFEPDKELSREVEAEVRRYFGEKVYRTNICVDMTISESNSHGKDIFDYAPDSRGAHDYLFLSREVLDGIG